jgi:hypothetical protein
MNRALPIGHNWLPKDLPAAIKQLDDQELDRLEAAVLADAVINPS